MRFSNFPCQFSFQLQSQPSLLKLRVPKAYVVFLKMGDHVTRKLNRRAYDLWRKNNSSWLGRKTNNKLEHPVSCVTSPAPLLVLESIPVPLVPESGTICVLKLLKSFPWSQQEDHGVIFRVTIHQILTKKNSLCSSQFINYSSNIDQQMCNLGKRNFVDIFMAFR